MSKFKIVTQGERMQWLKRLFALEGAKEGEIMKQFAELTEFRQQFLKDHLEGDTDVSLLSTTEFDSLLSELEGDMDFGMGLTKLISKATLNTAHSSVKSVTQKLEEKSE